MLHYLDISEWQSERRQALIELLSRPDAPDIKRGHRPAIEGMPHRYQLVPHLAAMFIQHHMMEMDRFDGVVESRKA